VIRTLEGLGHAVVETDTDDDPEESEVAEALRADRRHGKQRATMEGAPNGVVGEAKKKIDWEIPRKVFHSSIGAFALGGISPYYFFYAWRGC
jgi:diacylglycerol kinase (CTP)